MSINLRGVLYGAAKGLGWLSATQRSIQTRSAQPLVKRAERVAYGKLVSRGFRLFR
jgi:hypothetical protein